jgi:hypothetical protein
MADDLEIRISQQMRDVVARSGEIVVGTDDMATLREKSLAQEGTQKTGTTSYKNPGSFAKHSEFSCRGNLPDTVWAGYGAVVRLPLEMNEDQPSRISVMAIDPAAL